MARTGPLVGFAAFLAAVGAALALVARGDFASAAPAPPAGEGMGAAMEARSLTRRPVADVPIPAAWVGFELRLQPGEELEHTHAFATVLARDGGHALAVGGDERMLRPGSGASVQAGAEHVHRAPEGETSVFWEVLLTDPQAEPPAGGAERVFQSAAMRRIPPSPLAVVSAVRLPPGRVTTVHTHPGPAFVRVLEGSMEFEGGVGGTRQLEAGSDAEQALAPPGTPVQKRNPSGEQAARFLSFHLVAPRREFSSAAEFGFIRRVTIDETSFDLSSPFIRSEGDMLTVRLPRPGTYVFRARNQAGVAHTLRIEGHGVEQGTGDIAPGETADLRVTLEERGEYALYCDIPGHRPAGMDGRVVVGQRAGTPPDEQREEDEQGGGLYGP